MIALWSKARAWVQRSHLGWLILLVLVALFAVCDHQRLARREAQAKQALEAEQLRTQGQLVVSEERRAKLEAEVKEARGQNHALDEALKKTEAALKDARGKVIYVVRGRTEDDLKPQPNAARPACSLAPTDLASIVVDQVVLETRAGNQVVVGGAQVWRTSEPRGLVLEGSFEAAVSEALRTPGPRPGGSAATGWGFGVYAATGAFGRGVGPALALPPWHPWSTLQVELTVAGAVDRAGNTAAGATLLARW